MIGLDDGPFAFNRDSSAANRENFAPLIAAHLRDAHVVGVKIGRVQVDGLDGTREALRLLIGLPKRPILLSGVTFGGFNIIDPRVLRSKRKVPVIVVTGSRPSNARMKRALVRHFPDWQERWKIISKLGPLRRIKTMREEPPLYYKSFGCSNNTARTILMKTCFVSRLPEPLRVAGIIARGLSARSSRMETRP